MPQVKPIPDGYTALTPYLIVDGAARALDWYQQAFGAEETFRMPGADGKIGHAEMRVGGAAFMLADEHPEVGARGPRTIGGSPITLMLYVADVDAVVARAVAAGGKLVAPVQDKFYGDRMGGVEDPFGHRWYVATHVEDVSPEELGKRAAAQCKE